MAAKKITKRIPAMENGTGSVYTARSGNVYRITKHVNKAIFYLWKVIPDGGGYEKLAEMETPYDLYELIDTLEGLS